MLISSDHEIADRIWLSFYQQGATFASGLTGMFVRPIDWPCDNTLRFSMICARGFAITDSMEMFLMVADIMTLNSML